MAAADHCLGGPPAMVCRSSLAIAGRLVMMSSTTSKAARSCAVRSSVPRCGEAPP